MKGIGSRAALLAVALGAWITSAPAAELVIHYSVIEETIRQNSFPKDGRRFLFGSYDTPCAYAYLWNPTVISEGERVGLRVGLKGVVGTEYGGSCLGFSSDFPVTLTGLPYYRQGILGLEELRIDHQGNTTEFDQHLQNFFRQEFGHFFRFPLERRLRKLTESDLQSLPYDINLGQLDVSDIMVREDRLDLIMDFSVGIQ